MLRQVWAHWEWRTDIRDRLDECDLGIERTGPGERTLQGQIEAVVRDVPAEGLEADFHR